MSKTKVIIIALCIAFLLGMFLSAFVFRPDGNYGNKYEVGYIYDLRNGAKTYIYSDIPILYNWDEIQHTRIHLIIPYTTARDRTVIVYYIRTGR